MGIINHCFKNATVLLVVLVLEGCDDGSAHNSPLQKRSEAMASSLELSYRHKYFRRFSKRQGNGKNRLTAPGPGVGGVAGSDEFLCVDLLFRS